MSYEEGLLLDINAAQMLIRQNVLSSQRTRPSRGRWSWHICVCSWHKQVPTLTVTVRNSSGNSCACARSCACGRALEERRSCLKPVSSHPALTRLASMAPRSLRDLTGDFDDFWVRSLGIKQEKGARTWTLSSPFTFCYESAFSFTDFDHFGDEKRI